MNPVRSKTSTTKGDIHKGLSSRFKIGDEVVPYVNDELTSSISEEAFCKEGDIVFADASEDVDDIGKAIEIIDTTGQRLVSGLHTILASQIDSEIVVGFGAYLFASTGVRKQIQQRSQGAKVLGISKAQLADVKLAYPPETDEQQKIADCLASLDDLIRAGEAQLVALKDHKNGLMQQLFPREGETTPRLRFPEFRDAGEWEVKRLGEVGKISTGKTPLTGDQDSWNGETPWITPTDINGAKRISNSERKLTKKGATTAGLLPKDSVLVTCIASIGKNAILDVPGSCNQQINAIISKNGFNPDFIFYLIEKNSITMTNLAGGSSPAIIPKREFESLRLPFPDLPEQQKISDCLSSLDDLIRAGEAQLVALKDHKKGLMQQLFPQEVG